MSALKSNRKRLFLVDGYALLYRAHFAMIRSPLITSKGMHTSALYGFTNQIIKLLENENPEYLMAAFDSKEKTFRHQRYPEYKATREKMPEELQAQLPWLWKLMEAMNIPIQRMPGWEADDIIGTLAKKSAEKGLDVYIVSGDKDFMQLVNDNIFLYSPSGRRAELKIYDRAGVIEKWGVPPEKIVDLLGLMGDSSDNIPGVAGIGVKTAVKLLNQYGSLKEVLAHGDEVGNKRAREGLQNGEELALLSRELVTIDTEMDLELNLEEMKTDGFNDSALKDIYEELEFRGMQSRFKSETTGATLEARQEKDYSALRNLSSLKEFADSISNGTLVSL
ncbi:MAG: 5'-3' exonuclease H3TH domain-containing protein, partial [Candidatus Neomarinimicrobiota bacterium]